MTGKPRKDPETGYMMNHSLGTTDVTRLAVKGHQVNPGGGVRGVYNTQLRGQVAERTEDEMRERERDTAQQSQHFQVIFQTREAMTDILIRAGTHSGGGRGTGRPETARSGRIS